MSGTLVLDREGLSGLVRRTPEVTERLAAAEAEDIRVDPEDLLMLCGRGARVIKV